MELCQKLNFPLLSSKYVKELTLVKIIISGLRSRVVLMEMIREDN
jgi:hypothetical protein